MKAALIFPVVVLIIGVLAVAWGRWGGKRGNREFDARPRDGESGNPERPRWMGPGTGTGSTGLGSGDGGGL